MATFDNQDTDKTRNDKPGRQQDERIARKRLRTVTALLLSLALVGGDIAVVRAQSTGPSTGPTTGPSGDIGHDGSNFGPEAGLSDPVTTSIVRNIDAVRAECGRYDPVYRIDCLQRGLRLTAQRIPRTAAYGGMRRAIVKAADKLDAVVRRNIDTRAPRLDVKPGANPRFARRRNYRAVRRENLAKAMAEANKVISELQTELLRATDNSDKRQQHYQRVAVAVQSTKVLLRS